MGALPLASSPDLAFKWPVASLVRPAHLGRTDEVEGSRSTSFLLQTQTARGPGGETPGPLFRAVSPTGENDP